MWVEAESDWSPAPSVLHDVEDAQARFKLILVPVVALAVPQPAAGKELAEAQLSWCVVVLVRNKMLGLGFRGRRIAGWRLVK
jgi:hypothetical protein